MTTDSLPRQPTPWRQVRAEYLAGTSVRVLCELYSIPRRTLEDRIKREGWSKDRATLKAAANVAQTPATTQPAQSQEQGPASEQATPPKPKTAAPRALLERSAVVQNYLSGRLIKLMRDEENPAALKEVRAIREAQQAIAAADREHLASLEKLAGLAPPEQPTDAATQAILEKIAALEGPDFLAAIDAIMGAPPAGHGVVLGITERDRPRWDPRVKE